MCNVQSELDKMRRRSARGGISTPPLSDDEDQDTNGITENGRMSPQLGNEAGRTNGSSSVGWGDPDHGRSDSNEFATGAVGDRRDGGLSDLEEEDELGNPGRDDGGTSDRVTLRGGGLSDLKEDELGNAGRDSSGAGDRVTLRDGGLSDLEEEDELGNAGRDDGGASDRVTLGGGDLEEEDKDDGVTGDRVKLSSGGLSEEGGELSNACSDYGGIDKKDNLDESVSSEEGGENHNTVRNGSRRLLDSDSDDDDL